MVDIIKVSYLLPDLGVTIISSWGGMPMGMTANSMVANFPNLFWIEPDAEGEDRLCCPAIFGTKFPVINTIGDEYKADAFVPTKTEGDNVRWHPRPYRP